MKRPINNPFTQIEEYNCFGCSPKNPKGLHMTFYEDGEEVVSEWEPRAHFQGYGNVLHGGVISTLMDEIASWYIFSKLKTAGVTYQLQCRFLSPVYTNKGVITLRARLKAQNRRKTDIDVKLYDHENNLCAEGDIGYFVFPEKWATEKLYYPDFDSFFDD
jgi:acyl-coenzyme A thioesterase PaaI-like protein